MNITKKKQIQRFREETTGYPWGEGKGRGNTVDISLFQLKYSGYTELYVTDVQYSEPQFLKVIPP